jgi:hypothetical protein
VLNFAADKYARAAPTSVDMAGGRLSFTACISGSCRRIAWLGMLRLIQIKAAALHLAS